MAFKPVPSLERLLRTIHSWLGFVVMPWIIIIGLTGVYLNHSRLFAGLLYGPVYNEAQFDAWPDPRPVDEVAARVLAQSVWPEARFRRSATKLYHKRPAWIFKSGQKQVIVARATGHYWVKTRTKRLTFDPTGRLLHSKIYWGSIFKNLHVNGWINSTFGSWLADLTAGAMVVFGFSGMFLFISPRLRRHKNRRARRQLETGATKLSQG